MERKNQIIRKIDFIFHMNIISNFTFNDAKQVQILNKTFTTRLKNANK